MKLGPRLKAIADMIPEKSKVSDIGTDHGYIPVNLVKSGISDKVIATDINEDPLNKAIELIKLYQLEDKIQTRLGNGLEVINPGEVNVVVIAGMGGVLIKDILEAGRIVLEKVEKLVIQPMNAQEVVRQWLVENGFVIDDEVLARGNHKIYQIISAIPGYQKIEDPLYYEIGEKLIEKKDVLLPVLLEQKIKEYSEIINNLKKVHSHRARVRLEECEKKVERYEEVMRYCH